MTEAPRVLCTVDKEGSWYKVVSASLERPPKGRPLFGRGEKWPTIHWLLSCLPDVRVRNSTRAQSRKGTTENRDLSAAEEQTSAWRVVLGRSDVEGPLIRIIGVHILVVLATALLLEDSKRADEEVDGKYNVKDRQSQEIPWD
ncbi:hypothetical protein R1flu_005449 [Riccia fluitans]|uniref:Uncharacterized protein n=1 Tax=Riccia fluitans TaxID=41844 RepID=A0ABD1YU01_9MARC